MNFQSKTVTIHRCGSLIYITFPKLDACNAVRHVFSTRAGGVSPEPYGSMNMSFHRGDSRENVCRNYEILCGAVGIDPSHLVFSKQTHTNHVRTVTSVDCGTGYTKDEFSDVDGLITAERDVALVTQYADCTPLLFCDPVKRVVATSHAGWRGTATRIGAVTVEKMVSNFGCRREDIIAAIGPSIGKCCYEVDDAVYDAFSSIGFDRSLIFDEKPNGHYMLDLREANRRILLQSGIRDANIDVADLCTACHHDLLHSHRATGGKRGNLAAIIALK